MMKSKEVGLLSQVCIDCLRKRDVIAIWIGDHKCLDCFTGCLLPKLNIKTFQMTNFSIHIAYGESK